MTDAPALILVPIKPTAKMYSEGLAVVNRTLNPPDSVYAAMLSASPYIDGVPVEVVERMARAMFHDRYAPAHHFEQESDDQKQRFRQYARAALLAAGIKVADNG